jgi:hypothetical protein
MRYPAQAGHPLCRSMLCVHFPRPRTRNSRDYLAHEITTMLPVPGVVYALRKVPKCFM